ncbi:MAG: SRPBCC family protein [Pseudomonadota bacterium]
MVRPQHLIAALILLAAPPQVAVAQSYDVNQTLAQNDIHLEVTRDTSYPGEPYYVRGSVIIDAAPERIWAVMTDCEATEQIVPQLRHCEVEMEGNGWDHRRHDMRSGPFRISSVFRSDYEPLKSITISKVSGDLEVQEGSWTLTPRQDGSVELRYEAWSKPKIWVPRWFISRSVKRDAPKILANLKSMAERTSG